MRDHFKLSQSHPEQLSEALPSLNENHQVEVASQLAQVYSVNNPELAIRWLDSLENGTVRDAALKSSLNSFREYDIGQAFKLSETFTNEALRFTE